MQKCICMQKKYLKGTNIVKWHECCIGLEYFILFLFYFKALLGFANCMFWTQSQHCFVLHKVILCIERCGCYVWYDTVEPADK